MGKQCYMGRFKSLRSMKGENSKGRMKRRMRERMIQKNLFEWAMLAGGPRRGVGPARGRGGGFGELRSLRWGAYYHRSLPAAPWVRKNLHPP